MTQAATKNIQDIINEKFPGVVLESPIQGWVYLEEYEKGIEAHNNIIRTHTTAQDDRWLGVCYFQLYDDLKAVELFYRAIARGEEAARINLAHAFNFIERSHEVMGELEKINFDLLSTYNKAFFLRVKSLTEENYGHMKNALSDAEAAWRLIQGLPEGAILAPQILNQLGVLHGRIGRAQRGLWYFDRSLELTSGSERVKSLNQKSSLLIMLGRYQDAAEILQSTSVSDMPISLNAHRLLLLGDTTWANKDVNSATSLYEDTIASSMKAQSIYEETYARLSLVAIYGSRGLLETAKEHLARAKVLINDKTDSLAYNFRELLLDYWASITPAKATIALLKKLSQDYGDSLLLQEQGWVKLHIAELHRAMGNEDAMKEELDLLQQLAVTLQNNNFLAREWTLVPKLRDIALKTHPKIAGKSPDVLEIYTLGEEKMVLNGKVVNVRMKKATEIIAYLLQHGKVALKKLLLDVFADEQPKKARNYFHQFKHELRERLPSLKLEYIPEERVYCIKTDIDVLWDVAELRAGRKMGALGIFLPGSGSEWAEMLDHDLTPLKDADEVFPAAQS